MLRCVIIATFMLVAYGETMHHFRHLGIVTDALRERLGLSEQMNPDGSSSSLEVMLPELAKMLSTLHTKQRQQLHMLISRMRSDKPVDGQKVDGETESDGDILKNVITRALNHVLNNMQTVEGGQEAARWIKSLRGTTTTTTTTTTESPEENPPDNEVEVEKL